MRNRGIFSFVCYVLYTLFGAGVTIYNYVAIQKHNAEGGGFEGIALAILFILGLIVLGAGVIGLVLKGIHLGTGWGLFGFLCMVLDVVIVAGLITSVIPDNPAAINISEIWPIIPIVGVAIGSFISNALSLRR